MPGLEDLYREIILDHYRSPRNRGELESPPARRVEGFNPLCGDEIIVTLIVEGDVVADIKIAGTGCSISQSSASLMSAAVKGKPVAEVRDLIRTFKGMMSIHESTLPSANGAANADGNGTGSDGGSRARDHRCRRPGGARRSAGRGQVPGTHQMRHVELEHVVPGP